MSNSATYVYLLCSYLTKGIVTLERQESSQPIAVIVMFLSDLKSIAIIQSFAIIPHLQPSAKHCSAPVMKLALGKSAWLDWSSYTQP